MCKFNALPIFFSIIHKYPAYLDEKETKTKIVRSVPITLVISKYLLMLLNVYSNHLLDFNEDKLSE